jgi:hypothetical protein
MSNSEPQPLEKLIYITFSKAHICSVKMEPLPNNEPKAEVLLVTPADTKPAISGGGFSLFLII